jgi:hypothetical protein
MSAVARGASCNKGPLTPIGARANFTSEGLLKTSNTAAFNLTCGISEGLPVGLMLVAKRYDEWTIYQAGLPSTPTTTGKRSSPCCRAIKHQSLDRKN